MKFFKYVCTLIGLIFIINLFIFLILKILSLIGFTLLGIKSVFALYFAGGALCNDIIYRLYKEG